MHIKNMRTLVRTLKQNELPIDFDMGSFFCRGTRELNSPNGIMNAVENNPCGTVACIAGHACVLAWQSGDAPRGRSHIWHIEVAREWLGLSQDQAWDLFFGYWGRNKTRPGDVELKELTKTGALVELRRLINTNLARQNKRAIK